VITKRPGGWIQRLAGVQEQSKEVINSGSTQILRSTHLGDQVKGTKNIIKSFERSLLPVLLIEICVRNLTSQQAARHTILLGFCFGVQSAPTS
jgi:hypothetical protein